jgi:NADP-dependent alcohol dehydrogenase
MFNFDFYNPTQILFGQGQIATLAKLIPAQARVLLVYGGGSIKQNGVSGQVLAALAGHHVSEFDGVEPNPSYETLMRAIMQVHANRIDFVPAVGGGSVIDGAKFIAAGALHDGDLGLSLSIQAAMSNKPSRWAPS